MEPDDSPSRARLDGVIADYLGEVELGADPDRDRYLARHPDLADDLRSFFAGHDEIRRIAVGPAGDPDAADTDAVDQTVSVAASSADEVTFLSEPGQPDDDGPLADDRPGRSADRRAGRVPLPRVGYVGDYELLAEIARGGMGVVYKARQVSLDRIVALKMILSGDFASPADVQRFQQEAEAAARLEHPGIIPIYEVGEHEGHHFFSMAYADGPSLAQVVSAGPLSPSEAAAVTRAVADAVAYAHQQGVIHRDLKPGNVLLAGIDETGGERAGGTVTLSGTAGRSGRAGRYVPRVTDFGLAKRMEGNSELTGSGQILGTPGYMPPEQAAGRVRDVGPGSDIYSVGAILYCLLTGRPPFQSAGVMETLLQVIEREPVAPRELNPLVPRDLETICLKCLRKEPVGRYATARELADELGRFGRGEPILARPVGRLERGWRWCRRNPAVAALTALTAVALMLGTAVSAVFAVEAGRQAGVALRLAGEKSALADERATLAGQERDARLRAERAAEDLRRAERETIRQLYVARMNLVQRAADSNDVKRAIELLDAGRPEATGGDDLRGFEWRYWWGVCHRELLTIPTGGRVRALGVSPDGRLIASSSGGVKLWNAASGRLVRSLGHPGEVRALAFSPDGGRIASGGDDRVVRVWDAATGRLLHAFEGHGQPVYSLAFDPAGRRLASAAGDMANRSAGPGKGELTVWDVEAGKPIRGPTKHAMGLFVVRFSPDGRILAGGFRDGTIRLWDADTGERTAERAVGDSAVLSLDYSRDGRRIACAGWFGSHIPILAADDLRELSRLEGHATRVETVAFHPDGVRLVSSSADQTVRLWDSRSGSQLARWLGHLHVIDVVAFLNHGRRIVSGDGQGFVKMWDADDRPEGVAVSANVHGTPINDAAFSPDGRLVVFVQGAGFHPRGVVRIADARTGEFRGTAEQAGGLNGVAFRPDGAQLATAGDDGVVTLRHVPTLEPTFRTPAADGPRTAIAYDPAGRLLAVGDAAGRVEVWDVATQRLAFAFDARERANVGKLAFSPDGRLLAVADGLGCRVWNVAGRALAYEDTPNGGATGLAFSGDGRFLATARAGWAMVRDAQTGDAIRSFLAHGRWIDDLAFSPDGDRLATCSKDNTVKVWDWAVGQETLTFATGKAPQAVAFGPQGRQLAAGGWEPLVLWSADPEGESPPPTESALQAVWLGHGGPIHDLDFSPDGTLAVSASGFPNGDGTSRVWEVATGRERTRFEGDGSAVLAARFVGDRRILSAGNDLVLWDAETAAEIRRFAGHERTVTALAIARDGRQAVSGSEDRSVRLWDLDDGRELHRLDAEAPVYAVAIAAEPTRVLIGTGSGAVLLWEPEADAPARPLVGHTHNVEGTAFAPDGRFAVTGGDDSTVIVWDLDSGRPRRRIACNAAAKRVVVTPDGRSIVGGLVDGSVRVWDVETGVERRRFDDRGERVWAVAVSPDGRRLLSGGGGLFEAGKWSAGGDWAIRLWAMPVEP